MNNCLFLATCREHVAHGAQENSITDEKLLTYEDEIPTPEESSKAKADDLLVVNQF